MVCTFVWVKNCPYLGQGLFISLTLDLPQPLLPSLPSPSSPDYLATTTNTQQTSSSELRRTNFSFKNIQSSLPSLSESWSWFICKSVTRPSDHPSYQLLILTLLVLAHFTCFTSYHWIILSFQQNVGTDCKTIADIGGWIAWFVWLRNVLHLDFVVWVVVFTTGGK